MVLRSITRNVKSQNWLAVFLDFIIVVAGIFVGLQADAWQTERGDRVRERAVMEQLLADFTKSIGTIDAKAADHELRAELLGFAVERLAQGQLPAEDQERFTEALKTMFRFPPLGATMASYEAMIASGEFGLLQDQEPRSILVELAALIDADTSSLTYFRDEYNSPTAEPAHRVILAVPDEDLNGASLWADFEAAKSDPHVLKSVVAQHRSHAIFARNRHEIADGFRRATARIELLLG